MRFIGVLPVQDVTFASSYDIDDLVARAEEEIRAHGCSVDAIVGYYDFPVSTMLPILHRRLGIERGPTLESVLRCEHKYWSRCEQQATVPELVPAFEVVDPFDPKAIDRISLEFPFWLKPVKAQASFLGFRITDRDKLGRALAVIREKIGRVASGFDRVLEHAQLPPHIEGICGSHCIAESIIGGRQCTLEGYVFDGQPHVYGVVDSIRYPNGSSFSRYEYPSRLPEEVQQRMSEAAGRVLLHVGFDNAPFNAEFYWDEDSDSIWMLEVNTRISQSHCFQFMSVHGRSHHEVVIDCALGRKPDFGRATGPYCVAAKFMVREEDDGVIVRVPSSEDLARIEDEIPGTRLLLLVEPGTRLSDLHDQDSYTYELAHIYVAAHSEAELFDKYRRCLRKMNVRLLPDEPGRREAPPPSASGSRLVFPPVSGAGSDRYAS